MQDSKSVLGFNCKKRIEQLNFFDWLWLVLWNGFELVRNVIQWDLNSFFFSKNLQKSPSGWGLCPQAPIAVGGWGLCPQTPVSDTFEYTSLLNTSSKLDFYTFQQLGFALYLYQNPGKVPSGYGFRSSILRYLCPTKNFWWRHCVWFVVRAPPPIKNPGYAYGMSLYSTVALMNVTGTGKLSRMKSLTISCALVSLASTSTFSCLVLQPCILQNTAICRIHACNSGYQRATKILLRRRRLLQSKVRILLFEKCLDWVACWANCWCHSAGGRWPVEYWR